MRRRVTPRHTTKIVCMYLSALLMFCSTCIGNDSRPHNITWDDLSENVFNSIHEIFYTLDQEQISPETVKDDTVLYHKIQKTVANHLNFDVEFTKSAEIESVPIVNRTEAGPAVVTHILADQILYVYLRQYSMASLNELREMIKEKFSDKPSVLIWDFRFSEGFDENLVKHYEMLVGTVNNIRSVLLVNRQTRGSFEILARILQMGSKCIVIGEQTHGQPYKNKRILLKSGGTLVLPQQRYILSDGLPLSADPCIPDVRFPDMIGDTDFKNKLLDREAIKVDRSVENAMQLVKAYQLFGKQRF